MRVTFVPFPALLAFIVQLTAAQPRSSDDSCPCTSAVLSTVHSIILYTATIKGETTIYESGGTTVKPTTTSARTTITDTIYQYDTAFQDITLERTATATSTHLNVSTVYGNTTRRTTTPTTRTALYTRTLNSTLTNIYNATSTVTPVTTVTAPRLTVTVLPPEDRLPGASNSDLTGASPVSKSIGASSISMMSGMPIGLLIAGASWMSGSSLCVVMTTIIPRNGSYETSPTPSGGYETSPTSSGGYGTSPTSSGGYETSPTSSRGYEKSPTSSGGTGTSPTCPCTISSNILTVYTTHTVATQTAIATRHVVSGTLIVETSVVTVTSQIHAETTAHSTTYQDRLHYETTTTTTDVTRTMPLSTTTAIFKTIPSTYVLNSTTFTTQPFTANTTSTQLTTGSASTTTVTLDPTTVTGTRCTASSDAPIQALSAPTAIIGTPGGLLSSDYDDVEFSEITLPFPLTFYNTTTSHITVNTNGFIQWTPPNVSISRSWEEHILPFYSTTTDPDIDDRARRGVPPPVIRCKRQGSCGGPGPSEPLSNMLFLFWDDLYYNAGTPQGIFYQTEGTAPKRKLTFEYYASHYEDSSQYYHILITFYEARPNVVRYSYLDVSDGGESATVGAQCETCYNGAGNYSQYSYDQRIITAGLQIEFSPALNQFVAVKGGCVETTTVVLD